MRAQKKKDLIKTIVIAVLAVALVAESVIMIFVKKPAEENSPKTVINMDLTGAIASIKPDVKNLANDIIKKVSDDIPIDINNIKGEVRNIVYSDAVVSTVMSLAYPLLFDTLKNLGMMDFAENAALHPTGKQAGALLKEKGYTAMNKSGERKDLGLVLEEADMNWNYMNSKVKPDSESDEVTLWYTIDWGITDKASFYKAMNDMGEILRGVLEVCMQGKEEVININLADFVLSVDAVNVPLDAARIYNSNQKIGYESCIIYLFNMLGLNEGEYVSADEFRNYTSIGDMWKAILEPILTAVEKVFDNPVDVLTDMLVNFAAATENGGLVDGIKTLKMDGDFHKLASTFMGFENGEIFNLGSALIDMIESVGIKLSGNLNDILTSLLRLISGSDSADMPDMDISSLIACATPETLKNGNTHYDADSKKTVDFLISYAVDESVVTAVLDLTSLKGTKEEMDIAGAISQSKDGLRILASTIYSLLMKKTTV